MSAVFNTLLLLLQMAAMRSRGRGEAARGAALAVAGGPSEPTQQQQLMERVSHSARSVHVVEPILPVVRV